MKTNFQDTLLKDETYNFVQIIRRFRIGEKHVMNLLKDKSLEMRQVYRSAVHQMLLSEEQR